MPSNVESVINSIDEVGDDLRTYMRRNIAAAMRVLQADARTNIAQDARWKGNLSASLDLDVQAGPDGPRIVVSAGGPMAPYAPFVEFGTGSRTERTWKGASNLNVDPTAYPPNFPYSAPSMGPGMVANIIEWVRTKPVIPSDEMTQEELGHRIAASIAEKGTYAHPFMRPAWFHNELQVRQAARNALSKAVR